MANEKQEAKEQAEREYAAEIAARLLTAWLGQRVDKGAELVAAYAPRAEEAALAIVGVCSRISETPMERAEREEREEREAAAERKREEKEKAAQAKKDAEAQKILNKAAKDRENARLAAMQPGGGQ